MHNIKLIFYMGHGLILPNSIYHIIDYYSRRCTNRANRCAAESAASPISSWRRVTWVSQTHTWDVTICLCPLYTYCWVCTQADLQKWIMPTFYYIFYGGRNVVPNISANSSSALTLDLPLLLVITYKNMFLRLLGALMLCRFVLLAVFHNSLAPST